MLLFIMQNVGKRSDTSLIRIPLTEIFWSKLLEIWSRVMADVEVVLVSLLIREKHPDEYISFT